MLDKLRNAVGGSKIMAIAVVTQVMQQLGLGETWQSAANHPFATANRGQMTGGANRAVQLVVALVVGGLMAAFLLPIAIDEIVAVDTSSWNNGAGSLWGILPVMVVLAIFLFFVSMAVNRA